MNQPQTAPEQLSMGLVMTDKVATIGRRPLSETELSDAACTPKWLADLLPEVDTDPCSNPRSHIKSRRSFSLEKGLDGLKLPWWKNPEEWVRPEEPESGSVYQNFTYSDPMPWCEKTVEEIKLGHVHEIITLCKLDPSTEWWKVLTGYDLLAEDVEPLSSFLRPEVWTFDKRIQFDEHPILVDMRLQKRIQKWIEKGSKGKKPTDGTSSNNFCSAIVHYRGFTSPGVRVAALQLESVATLWKRG